MSPLEIGSTKVPVNMTVNIILYSRTRPHIVRFYMLYYTFEKEIQGAYKELNGYSIVI